MAATATMQRETNGHGPAPAPSEGKEMVYIPFGAKTPIKLTVGIVQSLISARTKSGARATTDDCIKFMMLCQARGLNPFEGDAFLVGYDTKDGPVFSLITAHQAFLKRAECHPEYDGMESGVIVKDAVGEIVDREGDFIFEDDTLIGGWATVHFKNRKFPMRKRLRLSVFHKGFGLWQSNPAGMIVKCFDEQTEVLTTNGFERFADVTGDVLQVTNNGLEATTATPFVQSYSGDMIQLDSDDLNFCVTPNHDMLTTAGKVEAGAMFEAARSRVNTWIPRCVAGSRPDFAMSDAAIQLAAIYLADGADKPHQSFWVAVSRVAKVETIEQLGLHHARHEHQCAGTASSGGTRVITTKTDKQVFGFRYSLIAPLVGVGKRVSIPCLVGLSRRQARLFVDTLVAFDGQTNKKTGVRRFYSSRPDLVAAFEIAAVAAGYAISQRKLRTSDISTKPNVCVTISERSEIGVRRWGRDYHNLSADGSKRYPGLEIVQNQTGRVWCVTVPSGLIVVRRNGFSMVCGNCAESDALRSSFPTLLGGLYSQEEMPIPVEAVSAKSEAYDLTPGRKRLNNVKPTPVKDVTPAADGEIPNDDADEHQTPEHPDAELTHLNLLDAIADAGTRAGLKKIGDELGKVLPIVGQARHRELMTAYDAKYNSLPAK